MRIVIGGYPGRSWKGAQFDVQNVVPTKSVKSRRRFRGTSLKHEAGLNEFFFPPVVSDLHGSK